MQWNLRTRLPPAPASTSGSLKPVCARGGKRTRGLPRVALVCTAPWRRWAPAFCRTVDGLPAQAARRKIYLALHKPIGVECTTDRRVAGNIVDFVGHSERVFPVGRLDRDSEGLILLTNDGDIVNALLRAEHGHEKEYLVEVDRPVTPAFLAALSQGVPILDTVTLPCHTWVVGKNTFGIILTQGLNRQIRRMCEYFDYTVRRLRRVRVVNVELGALPAGRWRDLTAAELAGLLPDRFATPAATVAEARPLLKTRKTPSSRPRG